MVGYIRYFYPSERVRKVDWDKLLVYGIGEIHKLESDKEYVSKVRELLMPIAPQIVINREV